MVVSEVHYLTEADRQVSAAHTRIRRQQAIIARLSLSGVPSHALEALLSVQKLLVHIMEDLRQQTVDVLSRDVRRGP
jgi:hypothetical protein